MRTYTIAIPQEAAEKLSALAAREYRRPRDQASILLIEALEQGRRPSDEYARKAGDRQGQR